jgi:hypothetical protein
MMNLREGPPEQKCGYSNQVTLQSQQFTSRGIGSRMTVGVLRTTSRQGSEGTLSDSSPRGRMC